SDVPCIVDADAIAILAAKPRLMPTVVTPHASELARALSSLGQSTTREAVERDPAQHATALATLLKSTVALKGAVTLIAQPEGDIVSVPSGPPYLATAGAGDVLAGVMGALAASGVEIDEAAVVAVWLHGAAAHHASQGGPIVAMDVAGALPH